MEQARTSDNKSTSWPTGLAMFSMFFGAGNIVFPLALGQYAQDQNIYAILGLLITAVGVPFLGLIAMTLFNGNYRYFFDRIGSIPGFIVALIIMGLIGPFGALPRCIALSFSTLKLYMPGINLNVFSLISCILIYVFTFRKNNIITVLGYVLTPFLLFSLVVIIIKGIGYSTIAPLTDHPPSTIFLMGLKEGYQTMDLLGAFFFCSVVLACLKKNTCETQEQQNHKKTLLITLKASAIGASLLAFVYIGFSYLSAFNSASLMGTAKDELLGTIALQVLGPYAGIIVSLAVALACLTTAIALAVVFAEFLQTTICRDKINYQTALITTLVISFCISTLDFMGIARFLAPILEICYPALITLCILNIGYKLFQFKPVKAPVFIVFVISLVIYLI